MAVHVDVADHLGRDGGAVAGAVHRVDALRLRKHPHSPQIERADRLRGLQADAPLQPDPRLLALEARSQLRGGEVEHLGQERRSKARILD